MMVLMATAKWYQFSAGSSLPRATSRGDSKAPRRRPARSNFSLYDGLPEKKTRKKMKKSSDKPAGQQAKVLNSETVYEGAVFGVRRDEVLEPSGVQATREVVTHPGSVVVLPVLPDGKILLIQQYRYAARQFMWELVAGRIDEGETPREAAARELMEETGYRAMKFRIFLEVFPTPGFVEEKMFLLLAEGLTAGKAQPEEDEKIVSRAYNHKQLEEMIRKGELRDAKSIAGILYYLRFMRSTKSI
jgi:ADP-ribose pyrophosphatase